MTQEIEQNTSPTTMSAAWAIFPLGIAVALSLTGDGTLYTVLPMRFADAGIAFGAVGVILSINRVIRLLTNSAMGWIFDRLPDRRTTFLGSLALGVITTTMYAISDSLPPLIVARLLWGLSWSGIWIGGNALVLEMAPEAERGHWVGIVQMWYFGGSAIASLLGGILTDAVGYRGALWIGAGISVLGAVAAIASLATQRRSAPTTRIAVLGTRDSLWSNLRSISPAMWAAVASQGVNRLAAAGIVMGTLGLIVQQTFGAGLQVGAWTIGIASLSGALLGSRTLISVIGAPLAGRWSDHASERWGLLVVALIVGAIGTALLPASNSFLLVFGTILSALAYGGTQVLSTAIVGDLSGKQEYGKNLGIYNSAGDLGSAVGPLVAYAVLPFIGFSALYIACGALMLAMSAWAMRFRRTLR